MANRVAVDRVLQALDERLQVIEARLERRDLLALPVGAALIPDVRRTLLRPRRLLEPSAFDHPRE